ncbi:MAG TPA: PQQ-binding-like beta-propeller repeat protein [Longimicrobium sp.]|jgi:hypothetical protein|uniref:LVIVD repeat-containing protein n=1 Tax=Longimicrobium sp. TaxID=2029185 RepID=UPI002ED861BF
MRNPALTLSCAAAALLAIAPAEAQRRPRPSSAGSVTVVQDADPAKYPARFEVVGRGPVTHMKSTELWAFRGVNGRDYVYTGTNGSCARCVGSTLFIWDVSDPAAPVMTDSVMVDAGAISDVAVNQAGTLAVLGRRGASSRRNGVVFLDLTDPAHPRPAGQYWESLGAGVEAVWLDGNRLYASDLGTGELAVLDVTNPRDARVIGRWGAPVGDNVEPGSRFLADVQVRDGLAYLAYWNDGFVVLDVGSGVAGGTPNRPRVVSQTRYQTEYIRQRYGNTNAVFPYTTRAGQKYVFVGDAIVPPGADPARPMEIGGRLHVFDVTRPESPREVAWYDVPGRGINRFWAADDRLYIATNNGGLRALDLSAALPARLRDGELAVLPTRDERSAVPELSVTWAAMAHNGLVFATDVHSGLWVTRLLPAAP